MTPNGHSTAVIVFVRAPVKGCVKTRLARTLGDDTALALYRRFVSDILDMIDRTGRNLRIYFDPPGARGEVAAWLGSGYLLFAQEGRALGERMDHALAATFGDGVSKAVLIGTDSPDLSQEILVEAFEALEQNAAVIGPASDGGYYLVGFDAGGYTPGVFDDIPWSTGRVFNKTMARFGALGVAPHVLPVRCDIDTFDDLVSFVNNCRSMPDAAPKTMAHIKENRRLMHLLRGQEREAAPRNGNII